MPHIVIEHSAGLEHSHDLQALCDALFEAVAAHPSVSGPQAVRARCFAATAARVGVAPQTFAHAALYLLPGRDEATQTEMAQQVLDVLDAHLPDIGSLSVRVQDLNPPYLKRTL